MTQHVGDLDSVSARAFHREVIDGLEEFLEVRATRLVADAHPDYPSTWLANELAENRGGSVIEVQHHLAHAAAVLGEHRRFPEGGETALALTLDGTGWGPDDTAWGGEWLRLDGITSMATPRPPGTPCPHRGREGGSRTMESRRGGAGWGRFHRSDPSAAVRVAGRGGTAPPGDGSGDLHPIGREPPEPAGSSKPPVRFSAWSPETTGRAKRPPASRHWRRLSRPLPHSGTRSNSAATPFLPAQLSWRPLLAGSPEARNQPGSLQDFTAPFVVWLSISPSASPLTAQTSLPSAVDA